MPKSISHVPDERGPWKVYVVQENFKDYKGRRHWYNMAVSFSRLGAMELLIARFNEARTYRKHKPSRRRFRVKAFVLTEVNHV